MTKPRHHRVADWLPTIALGLTVLFILIIITMLAPARAEARPSQNAHRVVRDVTPSIVSLTDTQQFSARRHRSHHVRHHTMHRHRGARSYIDANGNRASGLVTVSTAMGNVTVSPSFAPKIVPFINALAARGYHARQVHCFSMAKSHVARSLHKTGNACDFAQRGWGKTDGPMYHVADLARQFGLRDGCSFRDCGHVDNGTPLGGNYYAARSHHRQPRYHRYASAR